MTSFHKVKLVVAAVVISLIVVGTLVYGLDYYRLSAGDRVISDKHLQLRPSGSVGLRLGMLGVALFLCLYAYPVRKRWKWLQRFGKTKHWLDFHILLGISVPLVITLHSSFKFQGIAGVAYWLMMAVAASGFVGRYIYAQIPKSINEAALSLDEIRKLSLAAHEELSRQEILAPMNMNRLLHQPDAASVAAMSAVGALGAMVWRDLMKPIRTASLRRSLTGSLRETVFTLFGFLPSSNPDLENAIRLAQNQSRLVTRMAFLDKANQIFQLWHVVHRPFSYSFAVLACVHVGLVVLIGYY